MIVRYEGAMGTWGRPSALRNLDPIQLNKCRLSYLASLLSSMFRNPTARRQLSADSRLLAQDTKSAIVKNLTLYISIAVVPPLTPGNKGVWIMKY